MRPTKADNIYQYILIYIDLYQYILIYIVIYQYIFIYIIVLVVVNCKVERVEIKDARLPVQLQVTSLYFCKNQVGGSFCKTRLQVTVI